MRGGYYKDFNIMSYCDEWKYMRDTYIQDLVARGVTYERRRALVGRFIRLTLRSD